MAARDYKKGAIPYAFKVVPDAVLDMQEYINLPFSAKALMLDLARQYSGKNNGRLCPGFQAMQRRGWTSTHTLIRAKQALLNAPFAVLTRKGHPPRTQEWVGFTWWKLDYDKSMEIDPRHFPYLNFALIPVVLKQHHGRPKQAPGGAETALQEAVS